MFTLLLTTIITSFLDSLNPFAISQQFLLQGMVKKRYHIWFYILAMLLTNYTCGIFAYYGFLNPILYFIYDMIDEHPQIVMFVKLTIIVILMILCIIKITQIQHPKTTLSSSEKKRFITPSLKPLYLIVIGFITTLSELSTSLPYFTFLAILFSYQLSVFELLMILLLYNVIYCLPLILMYFIYKSKQQYFDRFYFYIKRCTTRWTPYLVPILCLIVILLLLYTFL